ncbi:hypothetical protein BJX76DRAFT_343830 [Aspergillus varians]
MPQTKLRAACNRCHAQKLRCVRTTGQLQCGRCLRLNTLCQFAPRTPRGSRNRPSPSTLAPTLQREASTPSPGTSALPLLCPESCQNGIDVSLPDLDDSWLAQLDQLMPEPQPHDNSFWSPAVLPSSESTIQTSIIPIPHQLANLNIALYDLTETLPSTVDDMDVATHTQTRNTPFEFDQLFHLTTQLTNIIQQSPDEEATTLMLASCYSRLAELYLTVFSLIQRCIQHSLGPPRPRPNWAIILPKVQLSSLSSPATRIAAETPAIPIAKSYMYMSMIIVFSGELWVQLGDAVRMQQFQVNEMRLGKEMKPLERSLWAEMAERNGSLLQSIERTKCLLGEG